MTSNDVRQKFLKFFESKGHRTAPSSSLIPTDASVLFTTAGMQQMKPYYTGEKSPWGDKVASVQKCIRTSDIEEVGDDTHLTFFEMLGNFAFNNAVSKREAITYAYEFITQEIGLKIDYVTIFGGDDITPKDIESESIWAQIAPDLQIKEEGRADVFWGPTGTEGPCGPTTEIYVNGVEIWNVVFNEYYKDTSGQFKKLENFGIDTGMGLERLLVQVQGKKNVYETDLFFGETTKNERIVTDHTKAALFLIADGVSPGSTGQGYILRRLIRRAVRYSDLLDINFSGTETKLRFIARKIINIYPQLNVSLETELAKEESRFRMTLERGLKEIEKHDVNSLSAEFLFDLYQSYGFPLEMSVEELNKRRNSPIPADVIAHFKLLFEAHQEKSRSSSAGMFKGGLANHEEKTVKLHTAHHLLLAALQQVLGPEVKQRGSNINEERLRIDFSFDRKMTDEEKMRVEEIVNDAIARDLKVVRREMSKDEAEKLGAQMEFGAKYGDTVSVYSIEGDSGAPFSIEFCGGPHITHTGELGKFKIQKEEASSAGVRRIKAILE